MKLLVEELFDFREDLLDFVLVYVLVDLADILEKEHEFLLAEYFVLENEVDDLFLKRVDLGAGCVSYFRDDFFDL